MRLTSTTVWDERFFHLFIEFRNKIHEHIVTSFPEKLSDYSRYFASTSVFLNDYQWEAFMVFDGESVIAKAILVWEKNTQIGNLGFIDWENNLAAAKLLIEAVTKVAIRHELSKLKTPVDINFYVKYRIRLPGGGEPFWGEPVYPDYYHDLFQGTGFSEIGRWDTFRLNKLQGMRDFFWKRLKLAKKPFGSHHKTQDRSKRTTIRSIRMNDWEKELKIIHELFTLAYKNMPEWGPISFEQFRIIYDDFKFIINPYYAYIVELRGKPVGFSINFVDPLPILKKVKGKELSKFQKTLLFIRLRTNRSTFLIAHVGKIPGPNGEEIKGVQIQVSKRIQLVAALVKKVLVTFQMTDSPSRRSFDKRYQKLYAQYVLYGKSLE